MEERIEQAAEVVLGHRRGKQWRSVGYGLHRRLPPAAPGPSDPAAELLADLRAWQELLPPSSAFTHLTATQVYGMWLPPSPAHTPIFVCLPKGEERPRRPQLRASRLTSPPPVRTVRGLRLASAPEAMLACARDLCTLDATVLLDSARRLGLFSPADLATTATPRRRGTPGLERAFAWSDARSESPWESVLRVFHVICAVDVEPQHEVYDEHGAFVARGDLWLRGTTTLHEYDGGVHRDRRTHVNDLARERRLANLGWTRRGYTSRDLLERPDGILREIDASLGRPHDRTRLDGWWRLLDESLFTPRGRRRLAARWRLDAA